MSYQLKTRKIKPFELYNNLEPGDLAELGFFLLPGEGPRKSAREIVAEHLWLKIKEVVYESNEIYNALLTEEPRFLKRLKKGDLISFSPENVLNAKSKKPGKKVKSIKDFLYTGSDRSLRDFKHIISDHTYSYAIDPSVLVLRKKGNLSGSIPVEDLQPDTRQRFGALLEQFEKVELDKFHVRVDSEFIKKSTQKIRAKANTKASMVYSPLIRISDRTYLSFNLVSKVLVLLKKMLIYLELHDDFPMLYFTNDIYEGFISLADQTSESIIIDILEK